MGVIDRVVSLRALEGGGGPVKVPESRARMEGAGLGLAGSARMERAWPRQEKS